MGLGALGSSTCIKRKFRWSLTGLDKDDNIVIPEIFVKVTKRPTLQIEETEINYLSKKTWIPGKAEWESMYVTIWDIDTEKWEAFPLENIDSLLLKLWDGCGSLLETWELSGSEMNPLKMTVSASPTTVAYDLDQTTIEARIEYFNVKYTPSEGLPKANLPEIIKKKRLKNYWLDKIEENTKYPHIYGFKTPQKHMLVFGSGEQKKEKE
jgi:hypothetical protein